MIKKMAISSYILLNLLGAVSFALYFCGFELGTLLSTIMFNIFGLNIAILVGFFSKKGIDLKGGDHGI